MAITGLIALFLIIVTLVGVIAYGVALSQKAKSESDKNFISRYLIVLVIIFVAGGITRTIQQSTGYKWLDGFVAIFLGLFFSYMGIPLIWSNSQNKFQGVKRFLFFLLGLFMMFLGLGSIYLGITQIWKALI